MAVTRIRIEIEDENGTHPFETTHGSVINQALNDLRPVSTILQLIHDEQDPYPATG